MSEKSLNYFYKALQEANYLWILLALFLSFFAYSIRAYRWKYSLEPLGYKTSFWNRYHAMMIGYLINLTIPRAGEATRAAMLYRSDGVPFSKSFGTIIAERVIDLFMLASISFLALFFTYDDFIEIFNQIKASFNKQTSSEEGQILKFIIYGFLIISGLFVGYLIIFNKKIKQKLFEFIKGIFDGVFSLFKTKNPSSYILCTLLIWLLYIVYFAVAFLSLKETQNFPFEGIMLAFIAGSLGISFTNGGIGAFPLLVALVVVFYLGKDNPNALAIGNALGMLIWVSQTLLLIILGLISLIILPKNYSQTDSNNV